MKRNFLKEFRTAFEGLGYEKWDGMPTFSPKDIWYRYSAHPRGNFHLVYFAQQPGANAYGVQIGAFNLAQLRILQNILPALSKYLGRRAHLLAPYMVQDIHVIMPWMLFIPNSGRNLRLLQIPDSLNRESWPLQLDQLRTFYLEPIFWPIMEPIDIQRLLLSNQIPCEWDPRHPVLRVAQILALSSVIGTSIELVKPEILAQTDVIDKGLRGFCTTEEMIDDLANEILKTKLG